MARTPIAIVAVLGAILFASAGRAAPLDLPVDGSNGPNMPGTRDVVPSEIRPRDPPATGIMPGLERPEIRSRWHDIKRPPTK